MFDTTKVAKRIKEARVARNMTQVQLADAMGVSYQAVSNWERGNSMPDISKLEDLCRALSLSLEELLADAEVEHLAELEPLAPFLSEELLDRLARRASAGDYAGIVSLAPFLGEDTLSFLVLRCEGLPGRELLGDLLPFLNDDALDQLARRCIGDSEAMEQLLPFLSDESLETVTELYIQSGRLRQLTPLFPFLSDSALRKAAKALMAAGELDILREAAPYL